MKLKINKACDLSSISVLPPYARRSNAVRNGPESSVFCKLQAPQVRSQQSQQSFSQGVSSQHGMFSQLSQNSLDEVVTNDQRFGSQERENSSKRISSLPPINSTREESQLALTRSSTNLIPKWNSAVPDNTFQMSEELEHKIGMIETSLSRFRMILESVQSDIMQVNKGTKEVALEMESMRQKLIMHDNSLLLMNKGQEDIKSSLDGGLKSICDQFSQNIHRESIQEVSSLLSALPEKIEACILKLQNDLRKVFTTEMQAMASTLQIPNQKLLTAFVLPPKAVSYRATPQERPSIKNAAVHPKVRQATTIPKIEMGTWNSVKHEQATFTYRDSNKGHKQKGASPMEMEKEWRVIVESDEDIDEGFSCLLEERDTDIGNYSIEETKEETERILRKARRRKRKHRNTIIIN